MQMPEGLQRLDAVRARLLDRQRVTLAVGERRSLAISLSALPPTYSMTM